MLRALGLVASLLLSQILVSCSATRNGDVVNLRFDKQSIEEKLCLGIYDIQYHLRNGDGAAVEVYYQSLDGKRFSNYESLQAYDGERLRIHYQKQTESRNERLRADLHRFEESLKNKSWEEFDNILFSFHSGDHSFFDDEPPEIGLLEEDDFEWSSMDAIAKPLLLETHSIVLQGIEKYYVQQANPQVCWAASLETAFRYIGKPYQQQEFTNALQSQCSLKTSERATVNQMFFAATDRHLNSGGQWISNFQKQPVMSIDFGELAKRFSPFWFDNHQSTLQNSGWRSQINAKQSYFYANTPAIDMGQVTTPSMPRDRVTWTTTRNTDGKIVSHGEIKLVHSVAEMILAMKNNYPLIVGFSGDVSGHTGVITRLNFKPGGTYSGGTYYLDHRARLEQVYYLDPLLDEHPVSLSADQFLANARFVFYLDP